jgi:hypothetical protein
MTSFAVDEAPPAFAGMTAKKKQSPQQKQQNSK